MWPFKPREQKEIENSLDAKFDQMELFLGTLEEYNRFKGVEHVIMDTQCNGKFVSKYECSYREMRHRLVEEGCTALIHYVHGQIIMTNYGDMRVGGYGVPVKRKE